MAAKRLGICGLALLLSATSVRGAVPDAVLADAAERMDRAGVRALLQQRVDVNTPQVDGMTALHWRRTRRLETGELLRRRRQRQGRTARV